MATNSASQSDSLSSFACRNLAAPMVGAGNSRRAEVVQEDVDPHG